MKLKIILNIVLIALSPLLVFTQEPWSLEKCIAYADSANLNLQKKNIDLMIAQIQQDQAKMNVLPSLNMGGTHGYNWGQSIDQFTNQFATDRVQTNNFYASSNWDIFSGLQNYYLKQQNDLTYRATEQEIQIAQRNLKMDITAAYMQVVLNHYLIEAAKEQVDYALESENLAKERHTHGYVTRYDLLAMTSQLTLDSMALIKAENNRDYSILLLKQLLNLEGELITEIPEINTLEGGAVALNEWQLSSSPEYELAKTQIDLQTFRLKKAKASLLPTIRINSSIGSGYSGNNKVLIGSEFLPKPFNVQMQENFYQSSVLTLNVPIFNKGRVRTEIKIAEAELTKTQIDQELKFQQLQNQLEKLRNEIKNEKANSAALKRALEASKERFEAANEQYNAGSMNVQNYLDLRNTLFKTQADYYTSLITLRFKEEVVGYLLD